MLVVTRGVSDRVAEDTDFAKLVLDSLERFRWCDWGNVEEEDWKSNDSDKGSLDKGGYGRIIASYGPEEDKLWIILDTEASTVLFPSEY